MARRYAALRRWSASRYSRRVSVRLTASADQSVALIQPRPGLRFRSLREFVTGAKSPMHSLTSDESLVASAAHCTGRRHIGLFSIAARKAGHGNDRVWKAWKAMKPASHPSHTLWKSLQDSHIPTASTTGYMSSRAPATRTISTARGL